MKRIKKWMALLIGICVLAAGCGNGAQTESAGTASGSSENKGAGAEEAAGAGEESSESAFSDGEKQKVIWFTSATKYKAAYESMAAKLLEEENIEIEFQQVADDQYHTMLKTKLATGDAPDIFEHNAPTEYGTVNAQENCVELTGEEWVSRLVNPDILKDKNGKIWAFPTESSECYFGMYYNKGLMEELGLAEEMNPKTYEEFLGLCQKIKDKGVVPVYFPDKDSSVMQCWVTSALPIVLSVNNPDALEKIRINEAKWTDMPELAEVIDQYLDLYAKGYINDNFASATYDDAIAAVADGSAAMHFNGDFFAASVLEANPDAKVGMFAMSMKDGVDVATENMSSPGFVAYKDSANLDTVKKVFDLWSTPEYADLYFADVLPERYQR